MSSAQLVQHIDRLFEQAITDPLSIEDAVLAEWSETALEVSGSDRAKARAIRAAVRTSRRLAKYWTGRDAAGLPDWRNGVDEALGGLGWRPQLELMIASLDLEPDPELFEMAKALHRSVHFSEWMEGVSYEEWLAERG